MIEYAFKNSKDTSQLLKDHKENIARLDALKNFNFAFQLIDLIKSLDVKEFALNYIKDEYNDEGLYDGVYTSATDKDMKVIREYGSSFEEYVNNQVDDKDEYTDVIYNQINENKKLIKLNKFFTDMIETHNERKLVGQISCRVFSTVEEKDFHKIIGALVGTANLKEWEINLDKMKLDENIDGVKSVTSTNVDTKTFRKKI